MTNKYSGNILIRLEAVRARTGLARSTLYKMISTGDFPAQIKITEKAVAWASNEVDQWITKKMTDRGTH